MSNTILLTGGTGFFGRALLRHLCTHSEFLQRHKYFILSRNPIAFSSNYPELTDHENIVLLKGDILDTASLPHHINFTHILHAATDSTLGPHLAPVSHFEQIYKGTENILQLCIKTNCQHFLLTSSGGVYGSMPPSLDAFDEDWSGAPPLMCTKSAYSHGKRSAEHLCALYQQAYGIRTTIARCFSFIGPDLPIDAHFAIGNFIRDALYKPFIIVRGDGSPLRTYLDQRDLANWLLTLLFTGGCGDVFNVGSDDVISVAQLAHLVRDLISPHKKVHILGAPSTGSRNIYVPDISKIAKLHSLSPTFTLTESILYTAKHLVSAV